MRVVLRPELEKYVADKVRTGQYSDASELVNQALEVLRDQEVLSPEHEAFLRRELRTGADDLDAGRVSTLTADEIIAEERARLDRGKGDR